MVVVKSNVTWPPIIGRAGGGVVLNVDGGRLHGETEGGEYGVLRSAFTTSNNIT